MTAHWQAPTVRPERAFVRMAQRLRPEPPLREAGRASSRRRIGLCPELDCVRSRLSPGLLAAAEHRAAEVGVGADRVLVAAGAISEDAYGEALASWLGVRFETCVGLPRAACPLPDERLTEAARTGLLPLKIRGRVVLVVAPRGIAARRLVSMIADHPRLRERIRITTAARLRRFVRLRAGEAIGRQAADALRRARPDLSAGTPLLNRVALLALVLVAAACLWFPSVVFAVGDIGLTLVFLAWTAFRLLGAAAAPPAAVRSRRISDDRLPVYSIIVALYHEAAAAPALIAALRRLDYPLEKLDIKLVVEPDDRETRAALERVAPGAPFEIIVAPSYGPKTKPKALNAALPFVRGGYVAVYDAEDRPDPGQLRTALAAFQSAGRDVACVQAALTIDNTADTWLTRLFTAEYAGLFDILLPGLAGWRLPLPLGGSSNHFRTAVLRRVGAWDPHNVTEDADLGMRLARAGFRSTVIESTTYEEAPARLLPWLKQRTRWFKGWMQTWLVHMREPRRLYRELGPAGFCGFQLVVGGSVLSALAHPLFLGMILASLATDTFFPHEPGLIPVLLTALHASAIVGGYLTSGVLALLGLERRKLLGAGWALLLMPAHWLLLSVAAWRALAQLVYAPQRWEKTPHGLARTSRLGRNAPWEPRLTLRADRSYTSQFRVAPVLQK